MTDKILNKAHDYARNHIERTEEDGYDIIEEMRLVDAYLAGAEDNTPQWHKVADGDLPVDTDGVLVCTKDDETMIDYYHSDTGWEISNNDDIVAWQYIEPPRRYKNGSQRKF